MMGPYPLEPLPPKYVSSGEQDTPVRGLLVDDLNANLLKFFAIMRDSKLVSILGNCRFEPSPRTMSQTPYTLPAPTTATTATTATTTATATTATAAYPYGAYPAYATTGTYGYGAYQTGVTGYGWPYPYSYLQQHNHAAAAAAAAAASSAATHFSRPTGVIPPPTIAAIPTTASLPTQYQSALPQRTSTFSNYASSSYPRETYTGRGTKKQSNLRGLFAKECTCPLSCLIQSHSDLSFQFSAEPDVRFW